jgi:hypothetical protein
MDAVSERRRKALQGIGIAFVALGVGTHLVERRLLRVRTTTNAWGRRVGMALDNPGAVTSVLGMAALEASRRVTPKR